MTARYGEAMTEPVDQLRLALMGLNDLIAPWHEWLMGEVAYFTGQGFTDVQAREMAVAAYMMAMRATATPEAGE